MPPKRNNVHRKSVPVLAERMCLRETLRTCSTSEANCSHLADWVKVEIGFNLVRSLMLPSWKGMRKAFSRREWAGENRWFPRPTSLLTHRSITYTIVCINKVELICRRLSRLNLLFVDGHSASFPPFPRPLTNFVD